MSNKYNQIIGFYLILMTIRMTIALIYRSDNILGERLSVYLGSWSVLLVFVKTFFVTLLIVSASEVSHRTQVIYRLLQSLSIQNFSIKTKLEVRSELLRIELIIIIILTTS